MMDIIKEQAVKKQSTAKNSLLKAGIIVLVFIISIMLFILIPTFAPILIAVIIFGAYYALSLLDVEYEYIFTNGELDIDCIYSKKRRKRLYSGRVADFELMAHVDDKTHSGDFKSAAETKNYSSGTVTSNTYAFLTVHNGKKLKIIFEPNSEMIQALSTALSPRKLFKKK